MLDASLAELNRGSPLEVLPPPPPPDLGWYVCYDCGFHARKARVLAAHRGRCHEQDAALKAWVSGTTCQACMTQFHDVGRLHKHLHQVPRCKEQWRAWPGRDSPEVLQQWREQDLARQRTNRAAHLPDHYAHVPSIKVYGPPLPPLVACPPPSR
eukprot:999861-Pyramimonas_sp.AAC.1